MVSGPIGNTIQGFFTDGSCEVYCKQNGGVERQPTFPASMPCIAVLEKRGEITTCGARHVVNTLLKEGSFRLDRTLQGLEVRLLLQSCIKCRLMALALMTRTCTEMMVCAVHQVPAGQVNCNTCDTVHTFYECPSLPGMDREAQKQFFHTKALEKCNSKRNQYNVNQICDDDECSDRDREEHHEDVPASRSTDTPNWGNQDWVDYQRGSLVSDQNFW
jgi:hypothetical protein